MERLLGILDRWAVPAGNRTPATTMLYATVRSCAETAAAYARMDRDGAAAWQERAAATRPLIPDLAERYPRSASLAPVTPQWRDAPRAGVIAAVRLLATSISA
jgi:hypothetical protein